ncbi:MAG TPA: DUF2314 domain-containing protein [Chthoniobacteraceae bacterium]|nr:DUF2314 domain-containing protein [Chthoniobacteraceae bacterium]
MKPNLLPTILAGALCLGAVQPAMADHLLGHQQIAPGSEPQMFDVQQHNSHMRRAVHEARRTVGYFIKELQHPSTGQYDFEVKKPFRQGDVVEHLWLSGVKFRGNRFDGYVDNVPRKIKGLKLGAHVSVNPNEISDWAFVQDGRLIGGYTIRVLYDELTPGQRAQFSKEADFKIANPR